MKLTEQQLAQLFQNNTKNQTAKTQPSDCLAEAAASTRRVQQVEALMDDHISAQGLKMAMNLQDWSQQLGSDIKQSQRPWYNFFGAHNPLKTALTTGALAVTMIYSWQFIDTESPQHSPVPGFKQPIVADVINVMPFDAEPADQLFQSGLDQIDTDGVFNASFG